jgi:histidyl-tRNA synthetase
MMKTIRGVKDILPDEIKWWRYIENIAREVFESYGYKEIRTPLLENTSLFERSIGSGSDIVHKEMYTFRDRANRSVTLRPEGTAGVVRAYFQHKLWLRTPLVRVYYIGPMYRYERPQKGRYREFYQIGLELIGSESPMCELEIISLTQEVLKKLALTQTQIHLNSLGCDTCRKKFLSEIVKLIKPLLREMCDDCHHRFNNNPLRVLDCKEESCQEKIKELPEILHFLCQNCQEDFKRVRDYLEIIGLKYQPSPRLVRGFDYYQKTVFEVTAPSLGALDAICGGGRYNLEKFGGKPVPGIGASFGLERLVSLIESREQNLEDSSIEVFLVYLGEKARRAILKIMLFLRENGVKVGYEVEHKSLRAQLNTANKKKVKYCLIVGEEEIRKGKFILKEMFGERKQKEITPEEILSELGKRNARRA